MGLIQTFVISAKAIITLGNSVNRTNRQNIINVVNDLHGELTRAILLADSYLRGAKVSENDKQLAIYLRQADSKLMNTYLEHHICAGIYSLRDRLKGIFDPAQYSIGTSTKGDVDALINELSNGERMIIDDLQDLIMTFRDYADDLDSAITEEDRGRVRSELHKAIEHHQSRLSDSQKQIKKTARTITDKL